MPKIGVLSKMLLGLVIVMLLAVGVAGCSAVNADQYTGEAINITDTDFGRQAIARAVARWNARYYWTDEHDEEYHSAIEAKRVSAARCNASPDWTDIYAEEDFAAYELPRVSGQLRISIRPKDSEIVWMRVDGKLLPGATSGSRK